MLRASDPRRVNHYDEQYNPIVVGHDELDEDLQDFHTTRSLFENLREFLRENPAVIRQVFNCLTNEPLFSENPAVVEELNGALIDLERPDVSECAICRVCIYHNSMFLVLILLANVNSVGIMSEVIF